MSITSNFINQRVSTPTPGKWSSNFSKCKSYAIKNNVPLIAIWSRGDGCGYCEHFETSSMNKIFKEWMATTGYIFWFGYTKDTSTDDKYEGTGFNWVWYNRGSCTFPICRTYWAVNGKVKVNAITDGMTIGKNDNRYNYNKNYFSKLLAEFTPAPPEPVTCSITFNPNGGTLTSGMTRTVNINTAVGELPVPTRSGWTFNGWFTAVSGGVQMTAATVITASATYYARWTETPVAPTPPSQGNTPSPPVVSGQPLKTMFGLCRDCTIITKDNKILQYSAAAQRISLVGNYNPAEFLEVSTNIT